MTPLFIYILGSCPITLGYILISLPVDNSCQSVKKQLICKQTPRKWIIILILLVIKLGHVGEKSKTSTTQHEILLSQKLYNRYYIIKNFVIGPILNSQIL